MAPTLARSVLAPSAVDLDVAVHRGRARADRPRDLLDGHDPHVVKPLSFPLLGRREAAASAAGPRCGQPGLGAFDQQLTFHSRDRAGDREHQARRGSSSRAPRVTVTVR